ncbi:hypothetical protein GCM10022279_22190 [Comamonas faecalis]|uniref:Uncharacterized protein n=1 Tax=Comamonas faecalis TaxID=1387849 RepID=A0ABP7RIQ5_9BURK
MAAGPEAWNITVEIGLYRQHAEMAPAAELLWELAEKRIPCAIPDRTGS